MKKKALSLALALALCLGLTVPVSASYVASPANSMAGSEKITVTINAKDTSNLDLGKKSFSIRNWNYDEGTGAETKTAAETFTPARVFALPAGAELIVEGFKGDFGNGTMTCQAWSDPDGDGVFDGRIAKTTFTYEEDGMSLDSEVLPAGTAGPLESKSLDGNDGDGDIAYTDDWVIVDDWVMSGNDWVVSGYVSIEYYIMGQNYSLKGEPVKISTDYLIKELGVNTLLHLTVHGGYDDETYKRASSDYYFLLTDEKSTTPDKPDDTKPTTPVTPPADTIPASGTALASTQTVTVDGKKVEFQMYALADANGNLTNYIKLRDMAYVLNGTKAQFAVGYDGTISLTTGKAYEAGGTEMTTPYSGDRAYTGGAQTLKIDGKDVTMTAITLTDDNGGGYNYFKLRDLGKALGFNVGYSNENGVFIESDKPYAE